MESDLQKPLGIIIPVYNEGKNIGSTLTSIQENIKTPCRIYIVYDFDEDNTLPVAETFRKNGIDIRLVKNPAHGVVSAIKTGLGKAEEDYLLVTMADLSDDYAVVDEMCRLMENGYDVVCGSRYMKGGRQIGGPMVKKTLSRLAGESLRLLAGIPTHDATNSFKMYRKQMLDLLTIESDGGFEIGLEIVVKAYLCGFKITEVPCTWTDREAGESRFRIIKWLPKYLKWYFYALKGSRIEQRRPVHMTRKEKILYHINKNGRGIEIGPSLNPITPKKEGYRVHVIDHTDREQLIKKYKKQDIPDVQLDNIEEVDFVWSGEPYASLTGKTKYYDWIIASHIIEHTPDLIGFLSDCDSIMKDDAVISLAIPDKRYCFDHFRPITGLSKIIDSHFQKNSIHTPGTVAEYCLNVVSRDGQIAWEGDHKGEYNFVHSLEHTRGEIDRVINNREYIDVHAWCFTPHSFRLIIHDLYCLKLIPFREVSFYPTEGHEFYVTLGRKGKGIRLSRLDMLKMIEAEHGNG